MCACVRACMCVYACMCVCVAKPVAVELGCHAFSFMDSFVLRTGLMVRASDSGSGDPGSILGRVGVFVSLSKRHLLPKSTGNTQE